VSRVIGLLGGIASGKSRAAAVLAGSDGCLLSADRLAHELLAAPDLAAELRRLFGPRAHSPSGDPDRAAIAAQVFAEPAKKRALELLIHPRVRSRLVSGLEAARSQGCPIVCLDVPLLLENDAEHHLVQACDLLLFVDAPDEQRESRAQKTRGWAAGEVARREAQQWPLAEKRLQADLVLLNGSDLESFERRLRRLRGLLRPD
jgi:dephospho-CoA kinase